MSFICTLILHKPSLGPDAQVNVQISGGAARTSAPGEEGCGEDLNEGKAHRGERQCS